MNGLLRSLLITAVAVPVIGAAQDRPATRNSPFNYSYVELGYAETEYDLGGDVDGDGFTLTGSFELTDEWHVVTAYGNADLDFGFDLDSWLIGAGYRYPLRDDTDIYGRLFYLDLDADGPGGFGDADDDGLGLQVRLRHRVSDVFEVEGGIQYLNVSDSDTSLQAEARYLFTDELSVGVGLTFGGDSDGIGVNARYSF